MLQGVSIQNYQLFEELTLGLKRSSFAGLSRVEEVEAVGPLQALSAIVGKSDSGKSSLLSALSFLSDTLLHGVAYAAQQGDRGGFAELLRRQSNGHMSFSLVFRQKEKTYLIYSLTLAADQHHRPHIAAEKVEQLVFENAGLRENCLLDVEDGSGYVVSPQHGREDFSLAERRFTALASYGRILLYGELCWLYARLSRWFVAQPIERLRERSLRRPPHGGQRHLTASFDNVLNVLHFYEKEDEKRYRALLARIEEKLPDYKKTGDAFLDGDQQTGNQRLFALLLLLNDPKPRPLVCLDQPDAGLYHEMVEVLAGAMREYTLQSAQNQILIATHNIHFVECLRPQEVFYLKRQDGRVAVTCVGRSPLVQKLVEQGVGLGALWHDGYFDTATED